MWTESPEMNPQLHGPLMYNRSGDNKQWGKDSLSKNDVEGNWTVACKRIKLITFSYKIKINSKWIRFKWKSWNHKTSRRRLAVNFLTLVLAIFLRYVSSVKRNKSKINNKWDYIRLKSFAQQRNYQQNQKAT